MSGPRYEPPQHGREVARVHQSYPEVVLEQLKVRRNRGVIRNRNVDVRYPNAGPKEFDKNVSIKIHSTTKGSVVNESYGRF